MILINAAVFFYFDYRSNEADKKLQNQIVQNEKVAKANRALIRKQNEERKVRTDQNCEAAERAHLASVQELRGTYQYLIQVEKSPTEKDTILYKLIIQGLPRTISEGEIDIAPDYCDDPGYGLKEPDPVIPKRPDFLSPAIIAEVDRLESIATKRLDEQPIK